MNSIYTKQMRSDYRQGDDEAFVEVMMIQSICP